MPLTKEQIELANKRGAAPESPDGRINDNPSLPAKPAPRKEGEPITSMEQLPTEDDAPIEEVAEEAKPDFNDFLKAAAVDKTPLEDKTVKEEPKAKLETGIKEEKEEEAPAEEPVIKEVVKEQPKLKEFVKSTKTELQPRVVDDLPEELKGHFKDDMSRPAYEKLRPLILEHKTLKEQNGELTKKLDEYAKGGMPESYYEHPNAFVLTPDYLNGLQTVQTAQSIVNHWEQQFQKVKEGAAEYDQLVYDNNGNLTTNRVKADSTAETTILKALNFTQNQLIQQQGKLEGMAGVHKERHNQSAQWVKQHEDTAYSIFNTEDGKKLLPNVVKVLKSYHPSVQANPLAPSLAKADFVINMLANMVQQLQQGKTQTPAAVKPKTATVTNRRKAMGPINGDVGGHDDKEAGEQNDEKEVTMDAYNRIKEGY